jgi:two-component system, chemotaxis family, protein-glutamate methylesterase/glutaminase
MAIHDIVVIGASFGGVEALSHICAKLPPNLPAAVFVVIHIPSHGRSLLPVVVSRGGGMQAFHALDGAVIEPGKMYIAPPDNHIILKNGHMRVVRGPRENRARPAIDPLFRSAAYAYGPRAIGVVLTGYLDDGTAGLSAIKKRGGIAIAQDPADALEPSMPRSAIHHVKVDHVIALSGIPPLLEELVRTPAPDPALFPVPPQMENEVKIEELDMATLNNDDRYGQPSAFSCPECGGVLWEIEDGELVRYRCRVGHAFSSETMQAEQTDALENALWTALKVLEENATLLRRIKMRAKKDGLQRMVENYEERLKVSEQRAEILRRVLSDKQLFDQPGDDVPHPQPRPVAQSQGDNGLDAGT